MTSSDARATARSAEPTRRGWWVPPLLPAGLWSVTLALRGSTRDLSTADYVARSQALPSLLGGDDPSTAYRNWSIAPLALARLVGADSATGFAVVQFVVLVTGTAAVAWWIGRTRGTTVGVVAVLALFSTTAAAHTAYLAGSYA